MCGEVWRLQMEQDQQVHERQVRNLMFQQVA